MSQTFGLFIEHESASNNVVTNPSRAIIRDAVTPLSPSEHELDTLQWGKKLNGPRRDYFEISQPETSRPQTPRELEQSQPPTPKRDTAVDAIVQSATNPRMNIWRLAAAGVIFFAQGCNDGATGALIPYIEEHYDIGYAVVSLIFVTAAIGFICAAPVAQTLDSKLGRARLLMFGNSLLVLAYTALVASSPFPLVVASFFLIGFALGIFLAMTNAFIVNLVNGTVILGFMHGVYGIGGIVSPLIATAMVSRGIRWTYFYTILLSTSLFSVGFVGWSYKGFEEDAGVKLLTALERTASRQATSLGEPTKLQLLAQALHNRTTLLGAIFIFFYQGAEVSISGWVISYLIKYRDGDPAQVGNVTSGFWAGITLGRFVLTPFAHKIGEKASVFGLVIGAAAFQLLVWLVPNVIGNAVAESIVGLLLGPVYPLACSIYTKLLPRSIQISSFSVVGSLGSSGGAVLPFITGLLAQKLGTVVLHPIVLISFSTMIVMWSFLPRVGKRSE